MSTAVILAVVVLSCCLSATTLAAGFLVTPVDANLGAVNASVETIRELAGGVSVFLSGSAVVGLASTNSVRVAVAKPLTEKATGKVLPSDRLLVGEDSLFPLSGGAASFTALSGDLLKLRVAVRFDPFDLPGIYEATLTLLESTGKTATLKLSVEALKWASLRPSADRLVVMPRGGEEPGEGTYLTSEFSTSVQVSANCRWKLVAQVDSDLMLRNSLDQRIPRADLGIRVQPTEWLRPLVDGFVWFKTTELVLAEGKPTGAYGGSIPVMLAVRLPYRRQQVAGSYEGSLTLSVSPY